jgi:two-component system chemotaxis response regulator CheB
VVGSVWSGEKAVDFVRDSPPDLVTLDINMPGRGGLETLSDIRRWNTSHPDRPPVGVLLVSALTERGAAITVEGLARGAFDFIRKPDGPDEQANASILRQQLFEKIDLFAQRRRRPSVAAPPPTGPVRATPTARFIVQHLPQGMTEYFADCLAKKCSYRVVEAAGGEMVEPRTAYVAPGGRHMVLRKHGDRVLVALNDQPPENGFRPSVDVFFRSVAEAYSHSAIALVLTGMGSDGARGLGPLKRSGAYVIAQDEPTSVVWGMPGAAVATGQVDEILPLPAIGPTVASMLATGTSP